MPLHRMPACTQPHNHTTTTYIDAYSLIQLFFYSTLNFSRLPMVLAAWNEFEFAAKLGSALAASVSAVWLTKFCSN